MTAASKFVLCEFEEKAICDGRTELVPVRLEVCLLTAVFPILQLLFDRDEAADALLLPRDPRLEPIKI